MPLKRRSSTKNPPFFSQEFFIQNHADIISCVAMVFVLGLLFQATANAASCFVVLSHNVTELFRHDGLPTLYSYGFKDLALTFFYVLICIVLHQVVQEFVLDKVNRRLHLSKTKLSKFNESGQLLAFYLVSVVWAVEIIRRESFFPALSSMWSDYPHVGMSYLFKFYLIAQISYWLHNYPELYLQKVKKDDMPPRITYSSLYLAFFTLAYVLNFNRIALFLSLIHYSVEVLFHVSRLFYFAEKTRISNKGFQVWNVLFVIARLVSITLSVLTFWYGLPMNNPLAIPSLSQGNFNTNVIRINSLLAVCLMQAWMMWNFITFHLKRHRERMDAIALAKRKSATKKKLKLDDDVNELPEVDQNTKITQRITRSSTKSKH